MDPMMLTFLAEARFGHRQDEETLRDSRISVKERTCECKVNSVKFVYAYKNIGQIQK